MSLNSMVLEGQTGDKDQLVEEFSSSVDTGNSTGCIKNLSSGLSDFKCGSGNHGLSGSETVKKNVHIKKTSGDFNLKRCCDNSLDSSTCSDKKSQCRGQTSDCSLSREFCHSKSKQLEGTSLQRHNIDVVITSCHKDLDGENDTFKQNVNNMSLPDKMAESLSSLYSSTSAPLLHPDRQGRYRHRSGGWIPEKSSPLDETAARPRLRLSRDHVQPSEGSLSELHGSPRRDASQEEMDEDFDELQPLPRPRSSTCPEIKAFKRKTRVRLMNRPPTPPPGDCSMRRLSGRDGEAGSREKLEEGGAEGVRFSLDNQDEAGVDWRVRRTSDCCMDLPIIEES